MVRLFLSEQQLCGPEAVIEGQAYTHLARVLRVRPGDELILLDNRGAGFHAVLTGVDGVRAYARLVRPAALPPEPAPGVWIAQAIGKLDKLDQVLQHGTELGAQAFCPLQAERCDVRIPADRIPARMERWRAIVRAAAEQSGRSRMPELLPPCALDRILERREEFGAALLLHPGASLTLKRALTGAHPARILLCVGPEGGWSTREIACAEAHGLGVASLGLHTLRTETAALAAVSQILYHFQAS